MPPACRLGRQQQTALDRFQVAGFIAPCLPSKAQRPPSGEAWLHEIKHDGFRVIARKDGVYSSTAAPGMT